MKYFIRKQIHGCFASMSSRDVLVSKELTEQEFHREVLTGKQILVSEEFNFSLVYDKSDEKFYDVRQGFDYPEKDEVNQYVKDTYLDNGWSLNIEYLDNAREQYYEKEDALYLQNRIEAGYVIPQWSADLKPIDYKGGFSDAVFNEPYLQDYLKGGGCHGYIGHSERKPETDQEMEKRFLAISNNDIWLLAMWLTSTGGRHFGDSLEGYSTEVQKVKIAAEIESIFTQAKRYQKEEAKQ